MAGFDHTSIGVDAAVLTLRYKRRLLTTTTTILSSLFPSCAASLLLFHYLSKSFFSCRTHSSLSLPQPLSSPVLVARLDFAMVSPARVSPAKRHLNDQGEVFLPKRSRPATKLRDALCLRCLYRLTIATDYDTTCVKPRDKRCEYCAHQHNSCRKVCIMAVSPPIHRLVTDELDSQEVYRTCQCSLCPAGCGYDARSW